MQHDLLIVGLGIAGANLVLEALERGLDVVVADVPELSRSTRVAAGLINPVVFRKVSLGWQARTALDAAHVRYAKAETLLDTPFYHPCGMWRMHSSADEVRWWNEKRQWPEFAGMLGEVVNAPEKDVLHAPFGVSEVPAAGFIETAKFLDALRAHLQQQGRLISARMDPDDLEYREGRLGWKDWSFDRIIWAEGHLMNRNRLFEKPLLNPAKGEVLLIEAPELPQQIVNGKIYMVPLGEGRFRVGSTYAWQQEHDAPTEAKRQELEQTLVQMLKVPFTVLEHEAGIRPTVPDRRPILGALPGKPGMYVFNGMGTKGVLLAPMLAQAMLDAMEQGGQALLDEVSIARFYAS
jgi:glycine/D-amino acid oxidase-like deaminating enzyme